MNEVNNLADVIATLTVLSANVSGHGRGRRSVDYSLAFDTGATFPAGGMVIDFQGATNVVKERKWARNPDGFEVLNHPAGYVAVIVPGTTLANWKLNIFESGANGTPLVEVNDTDFSADTGVRIRLSGAAI